MATITKIVSTSDKKAVTYKAMIRRKGWPTTCQTFRTKRDAEDWARSVEDEMVRGVYINRAQAERLTIASALDRYLKEVSTTKRATTHSREINNVKPLIAALGKYSLAALTPDIVAKYRDKRLADGKSANTVRIELAILSHLYTVALREWRIGLVANPVSLIRKPSPGAGRDRRLSADEESRIIAAASQHSNPIFGWIVRLGLLTGMRTRELVTLTRSQIDIRRRIVKLTETKNGSVRTVPLSIEATEVFRAALDNPVRPIDTDLVFFGEPGKDGTRRPYIFQKLWGTMLKDLGIANLHFHDLRHEAVSRLVEAGLEDSKVAAISGHKSMQMLKRYTHLRGEDLVQELDQIEVRKRIS